MPTPATSDQQPGPTGTSLYATEGLSRFVVAEGRLSELRDRGEQIPAEWVNSTGVLKPMGGVKGFGIALIVEALAGSLTGAGTVRPNPSDDDQGAFLIAIDVERLRPLHDFTSDVEAFIDYVREVPLEPGAPGVRMPGEGGGDRTGPPAAGIPVRAEFEVPMPMPEASPSREATSER